METKTKYSKSKDGKVKFTHTTTGMEFKDKEVVIGYTSQEQITEFDNKEIALNYIKEQLENAEGNLMALQTEFDKNDMDMDVFKEIGEYLTANMNKIPLKKLTKLNTLYEKYSVKNKLEKEIGLYKTQRDKIADQVKEIEAL